jgi:thioredoxin-like negative regulator of GroEL
VIEQLLQADRELNVDRVDQAEAIYRSVSAADPSNAIAVTGLARCALARGDDREAHELASRALSIDPEDDMARRMEARLAEILTVRGEKVTRPTSASTPSPRDMRPVVAGATPEATASVANAATTPSPAEVPKRSLLDRLRGH